MIRSALSKTNPLKYGGRYQVTLIPGDGVGRDTTSSVQTIFKAEAVPVDWEPIEITGYLDNENSQKISAEYTFKNAIESLRRNKIGLKGTLHTPIDRQRHASFNVALRQELDCFAGVSVIKNIPGFKSRHKDVDFFIVRENTEGEYSGLEHQPVEGVVESSKIITSEKSRRIAQFAMDYATRNGRKLVTCIHKANIMKQADGLFRNIFYETGKEYENLVCNDLIVDNASMQAVSKPQKFDVLVTPNLYGSIMSNIGAALIGGPSLVPGFNIGYEHALFEPGCRHVGFNVTGKNQANPSAMILSATMMLDHLGLDNHASRIRNAVFAILREGNLRTQDQGGELSTNGFTSAILKYLEKI